MLFAAGSLGAGSKVCVSCHAAIARSYAATPMALSSGATGTGLFRERFTAASVSLTGGGSLDVALKNGHVEYAFREGDLKGRRSLDYFLGAGLVGRSYATAIEGFLFQAPVSYYSAPQKWALSPGYERNPQINLIREVEPACLKCHATGVQTIAGTTNGYAAEPFQEGGIGCEGCHGAGDEHVRIMKGGKASGARSIVNPAKLPGGQRDSVCAQCHLPGAVEIARAGKHAGYKPGGLLSDSVVVFVLAGVDREATVNGHAEQLSRSACARQSNGKLWCGSCHDAHRTVPVQERPAHYRKKCLQCHEEKSCKAAVGGDCTACHMPKQQAATVAHAALTQHSIAKKTVAQASLPANLELTPFEGFAGSDRDLGLAYATIAIRDNNRAWGLRALELLTKVPEDDTKAAAKLAQLYDRMGRDKQACAIYERVHSLDPTPAVIVNLGACRAAEGKIEESIALWKSALKLSPAMEAGRLNLAVAQFRGGDGEAAKSTLREGLKFNPLSTRILQMLRDIQ